MAARGYIQYLGGSDLTDGGLQGTSLVSGGQDINLQQQDFGLNSIVLVRLDSSDDVLIDGVGETNTWFGAFESIPDITLLTAQVDVASTFLVEALLRNDTGLGFVGSLDTTILEASARIAWDVSGNSGFRSFAVGPVYENLLGIGLGDITVYSDTFNLQGFNVVDGGSFTRTAVPLPGAAWLMLTGLATLGATVRRRYPG